MQLYADPHHQQSPDDFIRLSNYSGGRGWGYCGKCTVNNCLININNSIDGHGSTTNPQNARQHCGWGGGGTSPAVIEVEADWLHSLLLCWRSCCACMPVARKGGCSELGCCDRWEGAKQPARKAIQHDIIYNWNLHVSARSIVYILIYHEHTSLSSYYIIYLAVYV